jgi:SAM-dependent methyltransferase
MAGLDLSMPMLQRLTEKAGARPPFRLVQGDATVLPFASDSFGAALACHVLHLIPDWQAAVRELARVVRPGGVILIDAGGPPGRGWTQRIDRRFQREAGVGRRFVGAQHGGEVEAGMRAMGFQPRPLTPVRISDVSTPSAAIQGLEAGRYSWTWGLSSAVRRRAARATREWAREWIGDLDRSRARRWIIQWRAYDVPA